MKNEVQKTSAQQFIDLVLQGMDCWIQAGAIAAKEIEENPHFIDEVRAICPDITSETVKRFQLIGQRKLHPLLALSETPGMKRLRKLPYEIQRKHVTEPIELLIKSEVSGWDTLKVDVRNLTPDQASQVFTEDGLRSAAGQRAFIEDKNAKKAAPTAPNLPYRIVGKKLIIMSPCTLDRKEMAKILVDME